MPKKKRKMFNGKPMSHWERKAKELVIEQLVRASMVDRRSIIGEMASDRLMEIARAEDSELVDEVLGVRDRCVAGMAAIMNDITGD
jgi:hypothetical protein